MSKLSNSVNACLDKMAAVGGSGKGSHGEQAVFKICEQIYQKYGGILYHSYEYRVDKSKKGNIKKDDNGNLFVENLGSTTEIDVLLVTPYRIFPIEVKAYNADKIILTNKEIIGCRYNSKSPVHQNEMHCRHLYPNIFQVIPEGDVDYIKPIVVFVDKCKFADKRTPEQKKYIRATILNLLKETIEELNVPGEYEINLQSMDYRLKEACTKYEKYLPCREVT